MSTARPDQHQIDAWLGAIRAHHRGAGVAAPPLVARGIAPIAGGRNNALYRCAHGGRVCCVKVYRADGRRRDEREWRALTYLHRHRPGLAPEPYRHAPDRDAPLVAMEYLPGEPLPIPPRDARHLAALAAQLGRIYALAPGDGPFPHAGDSAPGKIIARMERWAAQERPGVGARLGRWLASADRDLLRQPAPAVFGLADPNPLNWLWDGATGNLRRVDLEYAGWCDLENELADLIEGPWARDVPDAAWLAFAGQFAPRDPARFAAARRMFAHFWIGIFAERGDDRLPRQIARATALMEGY